MPNIEAKVSKGSGDSKRGSFATDHCLHPHMSGEAKPIPGSEAHLHGGHPMPGSGIGKSRGGGNVDLDHDGDAGRDTDHDGM